MKNQNPKKIYKVAILTPYLTNSFGDKPLEEKCKRCDARGLCEIMQGIAYGFNPNNLSGVSAMKTKKGSEVILDSPENNWYRDKTFLHSLSKDSTNLVIAGSSRGGEKEIQMLMGSGLLIARYSIFYGERSGYSGNLPEQSGYSLDIPKNVQTAKALLTNERVLEAMVSREESKIRNAISVLNERLNAPIIVTPFISRALEVGKA